MAYYTIDLDALKSMVSEYENLSKILEEVAGVTSMEVNMLTSGSWLGEDATFVCDNVNNNSEQMLTIRDNIQLLINELNKGLSNFQEAKKYANEFNSIFDDSYVSKSPEDICGKLLCDEEEIETLKTYNINISDLQVSMSESVEKAKVYLSSLNRPQTEIEEEINIFKKEIDELKKFGLYAFALEHYREMVEQADTELQSGLSTLVSDLGPQVDSVLNSENHSYEADILALLISRDNLTTDQLSLLNKLMPRILANEEDMLYIIESIGNGEWTDYQVKFIAEVYKSAVNNSDTELCTIIYNELYIYENGIGGFDRIKIGRVDLYLDPENDGKAFYTLQRAANVTICDEIANIRVEWDEDIKDMVLCFDTKYDLNGKAFYKFADPNYKETIILSFLDMNDLISDKAEYNLKSNMNFSDIEYVNFLSGICSDEDVVFICNLAGCEKGDEDNLSILFETSPNGLTQAVSTSMADYVMHLGVVGSEDFNNNFKIVSNSMYGSTNKYFQECVSWNPFSTHYQYIYICGEAYEININSEHSSYGGVYFDILEKGLDIRGGQNKKLFSEEVKILPFDDCSDSYINYQNYSVLKTIVASEKYLINDAQENHWHLKVSDVTIRGGRASYKVELYNYGNSLANSVDIQVYSEGSDSLIDKLVKEDNYKVYEWKQKNHVKQWAFNTIVDVSVGNIPGSGYLNYALNFFENEPFSESAYDDAVNTIGKKTYFTVDYENTDMFSWDQIHKYLVIDACDDYTVEGELFAQAVKDGYIADQLSGKQKDDIKEYLEEQLKDAYITDEQYNVTLNCIFGGLDMMEMFKEENYDPQFWNDVQITVEGALDSVKAESFGSMCENYKVNLRKEWMYEE